MKPVSLGSFGAPVDVGGVGVQFTDGNRILLTFARSPAALTGYAYLICEPC
jgi:hypothetical protein